MKEITEKIQKNSEKYLCDVFGQIWLKWPDRERALKEITEKNQKNSETIPMSFFRTNMAKMAR